MRTIAQYEVVRELGRGGMATVHLARQGELGRLVALKELDMLRASDPSRARRFLREARMASSLSHPSVVTVYDYFQEDGTPYIAMEYVPGGSLRTHVARRLSIAQVGGVMEGLLAGLEHAGRQGFVHRDIKPENVLLTADGRVKIADFGISKATDKVLTTESLTASGTTMGTPAYMAPEQALGEEVSPRTDLYSVGVVAFELLVGRPPFADTDTPMGILLRHVNDPIPDVASLRGDVDPAVSDWVRRLVAKDPGDRPPSALVAWEDLEEALQALHGSGWRRRAALPALAVAAETPSTRPLGPATRSGSIRTLPPAVAPPATTVREGAGRPRRRLRRTVLVAVFALAGVAAAVAGAVGSGMRASPSAKPQAASVAPRLSPSPSPSPSPAPAPAVAERAPAKAAAKPVVAAPAPAAPAAVAPAAVAPAAAAPAAAPVAAAPAPVLTGENADDGGDGGSALPGGTGENADDGGEG